MINNKCSKKKTCMHARPGSSREICRDTKVHKDTEHEASSAPSGTGYWAYSLMHMLCKCSATELHAQTFRVLFF